MKTLSGKKRVCLAVVLGTVPVLVSVPLLLGFAIADRDASGLGLRNPNYPGVYISKIHLDLTGPSHLVTLTWSGPKAESCDRGPFPSSPGKGTGTNDCNDAAESNRAGSNCTPKGTMVVDGIDDHLPSYSQCEHVTWFNMSRSLAFHSHTNVPNYPVSHGCVRLQKSAAKLIHNNVIVGKTTVEIDGRWTPQKPELDHDKLLAQLTIHEGRRKHVYADSLGIPTIGVGFNLKREDARAALEALGANYDRILAGDEGLSDSQINSLLEQDTANSINHCKEVFPGFNELSDVRKRVLVDMMFNLGPTRFRTFRKMIGAIEYRDFNRAADEMTDSLWYHQVKTRGVSLVKMMRSDSDANILATKKK